MQLLSACAGARTAQINDRYEFPEELDLDAGDGRFLAEDADRSVRNLYRLHSVLVHSGGVHGGHYYAFIRPDGQQWLKFDDDKARRCAAAPAARPRRQRGCPDIMCREQPVVQQWWRPGRALALPV